MYCKTTIVTVSARYAKSSFHTLIIASGSLFFFLSLDDILSALDFESVPLFGEEGACSC